MTRYRSNTPRFVDETVDGEVLIMDMVTGSYYTCLDSSTIAWEALKNGAEAGAVAELLSSSYGIALARTERDVECFVAELVLEEMLVLLDSDACGEPITRQNVPPSAEYQGLRFERYTDLADLILLDPVHDVSDAGWPHKPE